jgi:hypothetical protein
VAAAISRLELASGRVACACVGSGERRIYSAASLLRVHLAGKQHGVLRTGVCSCACAYKVRQAHRIKPQLTLSCRGAVQAPGACRLPVSLQVGRLEVRRAPCSSLAPTHRKRGPKSAFGNHVHLGEPHHSTSHVCCKQSCVQCEPTVAATARVAAHDLNPQH